MKFTIQTDVFQHSLSAVLKIIQKKNINPIFECVLLRKADSEAYTLTGSTGEHQLTVGVSLNLIEGEFRGVCLPSRMLMQAFGNLGKQAVIVYVSDDCRKTTVEYLNGKFDIPTFPADEYPLLPFAGQETVAYDIETSVLLPALRSAAINCNVADTLRPVMSAVALDSMQDGVTVVGTSGVCLYMSSHTPGVPFLTAGSPAVLLLPGNLAAVVDTAFREKEKVHVASNGMSIRFTSQDTDFIVRMIEGKYPNYKSVIPSNQPYHITVSVQALASAIKRIALFSNDTSLVVLSCRDGQVNVFAQNADYAAKGSENIDTVENTLPDAFRIGVNSQTLLRQLGCIGTDNVRISFENENKPILLREDDANSPLLLLMMPMLVS